MNQMFDSQHFWFWFQAIEQGKLFLEENQVKTGIFFNSGPELFFSLFEPFSLF